MNLRRLQRCKAKKQVWEPMKAVFACNEDLGGGVLSSLIGSPELPELHVLSTPWSHEQGFCSFLLRGILLSSVGSERRDAVQCFTCIVGVYQMELAT